MNKKPYITICGTTYQTAKTLDVSLSSVVNVFNELGVPYEVVIIDNYSTDGTYEKLLEWSRKIPLRVYRYKCSRGLGRALCIRLARGKCIFMIDLDRIYNTNALTKLIKCHFIISEKFNIECAGFGNRDFLIKTNYRDLNRAEDVDLFARSIKNGALSLHIPLDEPLYREIRLSHTHIGFLLQTSVSELRYVANIANYLQRTMRNVLDSLTGGAYTLSKFIREDYYVWNRDLKIHVKLPIIAIRALAVAFLLLILHLRGVPRYEVSKFLSNHLFMELHVSLMSILSKRLLSNLCMDNNYDYKNDIADIVKDPVFRYAWTMYSYERKIHSN